MDPADFIELARTIILGYGGFKLTEFMVFFQRFKQGLYGTFYGVFDPMVITRSLREFRADREKLLRFYEDKKRHEGKEREWERIRTTSLTFEEWEELKWLFNMGYEMNDLKQN